MLSKTSLYSSDFYDIYDPDLGYEHYSLETAEYLRLRHGSKIDRYCLARGKEVRSLNIQDVALDPIVSFIPAQLKPSVIDRWFKTS